MPVIITNMDSKPLNHDCVKLCFNQFVFSHTDLLASSSAVPVQAQIKGTVQAAALMACGGVGQDVTQVRRVAVHIGSGRERQKKRRLAFVEAHLQALLTKQSVLLHRVFALADTQVAWLLLPFCAAPRAQYALRSLPPQDGLPGCPCRRGGWTTSPRRVPGPACVAPWRTWFAQRRAPCSSHHGSMRSLPSRAVTRCAPGQASFVPGAGPSSVLQPACAELNVEPAVAAFVGRWSSRLSFAAARAFASGVPSGTPSATMPRRAGSRARSPTQVSSVGVSEWMPSGWTTMRFHTRVLAGLRRSRARRKACSSKRR